MTAWLLLTSLASLDAMQLLRALVAATSVTAVVYLALRMGQAEALLAERPRRARAAAPISLGSLLRPRPARQSLRLVEVTEASYRIECDGPEGRHGFECDELPRDLSCPHCGAEASALELTQRRVIEEGAARLGSR